MINIKGLDKAKILYILYNNAKCLNPFAEYIFSIEEAREMVKNKTYFDYVGGKSLKIDLSSNQLDETLYDLNNGVGRAFGGICYLRHEQEFDRLKESGKIIDKLDEKNQRNTLPVNLLTMEQVQGEKQLEIFEKIGIIAKPTDFDILLDGYGHYGLKNGFVELNVHRNPELLNYVVARFGKIRTPNGEARYLEYRPILDISPIINQIGNKIELDNGIGKIKYGEFPQTLADSTISNELENNFIDKTEELKYTGMIYSGCYGDFIEYEYKGNKYIRVTTVCNKYSRHQYNTPISLSNGEKVIKNHEYWVKVVPIVWLVDFKTNIAVSEKILFNGVFEPLEWKEMLDLKNKLKQGEKIFISGDMYEKSQVFEFLKTFINESVLNANDFFDYNNGNYREDSTGGKILNLK